MPRPSLRVAALLVVASASLATVALADTGTLPSGQIYFPKMYPLIHEGGSDLALASTQTVQAQYFNLAHCICSQANAGSETTFSEQIGLENYTGPVATIPVQLWLGTSQCDAGSANDPFRATDCTMLPSDIANYSTLEVSPEEPEISLYDFMNPNPTLRMGSACTQATISNALWVEADTDMDGILDYSVSTTVTSDTLPPPVPTNFSAEGAENAIQIAWTPPVTTDIYYYQAFCADPTGAPPLTPAVAPRYVVADTLCGEAQGVTLTATTVAVTSSAPDAGVDDVDAGVDAGTDAGLILPTGLATLDPSFLCGEAVSTATSMRLTGLTNGSAYTVALIVTDVAGNPAGVYFTSTLTPEPVVDFWEDLHERGSHVEGGFCLLAETYGDDNPLTNALRSFRDDNLGSTSFGRWLTDVYYSAIAPLGAYVHGSIALRIITGVVLAPVVAVALAWHFLTLPGLLALVAFAWGLRRRRRALRARGIEPGPLLPRRYAMRTATVISVALIILASKLAHAGGEAPYWNDDAAAAEANEGSDGSADDNITKWHVGLRMGPYTPQIDAQLGGASPGPYKQMFGNYALMPTIDIDRVIWRGSGQLAIGLSLGFMSKTAHPFVEGSLPSDPDRPRSEGDENSFRMIPAAVTAIYRATQLDDQYGIPVVPYLRAGLAYYAWWITAPDGNFATVCTNGSYTMGTPTPGCTLNHADGGSLGVQGSIGLSIRAERIDASAAQSMRESGLLHAGFFAELQFAKVDGFGSDTKLSVGDNTWFAGVDFEF